MAFVLFTQIKCKGMAFVLFTQIKYHVLIIFFLPTFCGVMPLLIAPYVFLVNLL